MKSIISMMVILTMWKNPKFKEVTYEENNKVINRSGVENAEDVVQLSLNELGIRDVTVLIFPFRKRWNGVNEDLEAFVVENTNGVFIIHIKEQSDPRKLIRILTHECIHIQQYHSDTLHSDGGIITWKDKTYKQKLLVHYMEYSTRPWERDAFRYGSDLSRTIKLQMLEK